MAEPTKCPTCGRYPTPYLAVDIVIELEMSKGGIVLIKRKNPPFGLALPGGFVNYGESVEKAAAREAKEETSLKIHSLEQLGVYSNPKRDPRGHIVSVAFAAIGKGTPKARDDAAEIGVYTYKDLLSLKLAFDHSSIVSEYFVKRIERLMV